jgi:HSP20 family molecular chaperone IbpA
MYLIRPPDRSLHEMARVVSHSENGQIFVRVEMPGLDPETDVRLELREGALALEVRHSEHGRTEQVSQIISIPAGVTADDVQMSRTPDGMEIRIAPPGSNELPRAQ